MMSKWKQLWAFIMKSISLAWKLMKFVNHKSVNRRWATFEVDFCGGGGCWYIFLCVVLHTCNYWDWVICSPVCLELCICYNVKSWHSVVVLKYLWCIQWKTVWEHSADCELYSSHSETEILTMNVTFKWADRIFIVVARDSQSREQ